MICILTVLRSAAAAAAAQSRVFFIDRGVSEFYE